MMDNQIIKILMMVIVSALFVTCIIPFIKKIALHVGAMDIPDKRKVHNKPMPRLGGLGMYLGFLLGYMFFGEPSSIMNSILIGSFIIVITGVVDDIKPLKASVKFIGQVVAACIVVFYGGLVMHNITAFGINLDFWYFAYPLTIFFILGCINCINLIDGLDGLAGGISAIYFLTIGIVAAMQGSTGLELVLGRGGDQAVVRNQNQYKFYGGRAQEVEKRTKVKARTIAQSLENLIKESSNVIIMGHKTSDMD